MGVLVAVVAIAVALSLWPLGVATAQPPHQASTSQRQAGMGVPTPPVNSGDETERPEPTTAPAATQAEPYATSEEPEASPAGPAASQQPVPSASTDPSDGSTVYVAGAPPDSASNCDPDEPGCQPASQCDPDEADCQSSSQCDPDEPDCQPATQCEPDQPECAQGQPRPESQNEHVDARENWFLTERAYPNVTVPNGAYGVAQREAAQLPVVRSNAVTRTGLVGTSTSGQWVSIGPKPIVISSYINNIYNGTPPVIGRVTAIATAPANPAIAYIGTAFGGVWRTTDSGLHWAPIFDAAPKSLSIGAVAVSPTDDNTVYVGTGEANTALDNYFGNGVYKSVNGGSTWTKVGGTRFDGCGISRIAIDASNKNIVLVATVEEAAELQVSSPCQQANVNPGLQRTGDGGATWATVLSGENATDVVAARSPAGTMYAAFDGGSLFKSTNHGVAGSWTQIVNGPPAGGSVGRTSLAVSANGKVLWVAQATSPGGDLLGHHLDKSTDGGATASHWSTVNTTADFCNLTGGPNGQCWYDLTLAVNPANANQVFIGGVWQERCTTTCVKVGNGEQGIHVDYHALNFDSSGRLWTGNDGGAYRSSNLGATWTNLNAGLQITQTYPGLSGTPSNVLLAGAQDNGSLRYTPSSKWHMIASGDGGYTAIDPKKPAIEYVTYPLGIVYQSLDGGASPAQQIDYFSGLNICQLKSGDYCDFIFPMVMDPTNHHRLYVGSRYLWRGTGTRGATATTPWTWTWKNLNAIAFTSAANVVAPAPSNPSVIYVATIGSAWQGIAPTFLYSNDGGAHFTARMGLPNRFISDIYVDPANAAHIWVTMSGFGSQHVFRSVDSGAHWTNATGNLPNTPISAITVDTRPATPVLYVGTDVGVFRSINNGASWARFGAGLPNSVVMDLVLDRAHNTLTAGTHGRGVWVTGL
jgi:hypothetical protein